MCPIGPNSYFSHCQFSFYIATMVTFQTQPPQPPLPPQHRPLFRMSTSRTISWWFDAHVPACDKLQALPLKCPHTRLVNWSLPLARSPPDQNPAAPSTAPTAFHLKSETFLIFWAYMLCSQHRTSQALLGSLDFLLSAVGSLQRILNYLLTW